MSQLFSFVATAPIRRLQPWPSTLAPLTRLTLSLVTGLLCSLLALSTGWAQTAVVNTPHVRAELVAHAPNGVQAGQALWLGLQLQHESGWHTYWRNPGDSGLPTQLTWQLPQGLDAGEVLWPLPNKLRAGSLTNYGFESTTLLAVPVTVSSLFRSSGQSVDVALHANWLVCKLECIPQEGDFQLSIPVNSSFASHVAAFDKVRAQQAQTLPAQTQAAHAEGQGTTQFLNLRINGLPQTLQGHRLVVFPEVPEILDSATEQHKQATQAWQGDVWTARLPLSAMRVSSPAQLGLLLVDESASPQGVIRTGFAATLNVQDPWPAVPDEPVNIPDTTSNTTPPIDHSASWSGLALALLGALAGGLLLNLMPCVLPVLAIKLIGFAQHSRQHHAHRVAGVAYTVGVVTSFVTLGAGVLALRAAGEQLGWGFQLQSPWVVSALAALFTLIALNLFGLFELGHVLPSSWMSFQARHPVSDALLSGVLAVAVASPCSAPFMGASLGLAVTLPAWQALWVFAFMGLGLALPYLLASFLPSVARRMPRPGPWMLVLRQLLGFPMLATVAWLLWVLGQQSNLDVAAMLLGWLIGLAALVWTSRLQTRAGQVLQWLLGLALLASSWGWTQALIEAENAPAPTASTGQPLSARDALVWQTWSPAAVAEGLAQGQPVFVDFTAAWCVTCQINKKTTLADAGVQADFSAHNVRLLRADWTRRDPAITAALTALGRSGVPVYVLYAADRAPQVLSELLSPAQVHEALARVPPTGTNSRTP